jgi:WD40 repeat protein/serine/threonine protein kinase
MAEGSFGAIYRAEQVGLRRQAVVKLLSSHIADRTMQLRFLREARLASALDHPYAAHIYAFGVEPDGLLWIAMELVRGAPLSEVLREGPMPLDTFVPFLERLCEVVHTAHERGIVHRDIKPQNVMVISRAGALLPKLLDLGIAKDVRPAPSPQQDLTWDDEALSSTGKRPIARTSMIRDATIADGTRHARIDRVSSPPEGEPKATGPAGLTEYGVVIGSPSYMAPEQWAGADLVDLRCDIYALGVLAYEAITGRRPFSGSVDELQRQHCTDSVPALPASIPSALYAVLARAMAKEPCDRPPSALELARELRRASGISGESQGLPKLARDVVDDALREHPQPLAEAVAELDGARGAYMALEAAARLARVAVRFIAIVALAGWWQRRSGGPALPAVASELLSALRKRRLNDEEWLELARAVAAPFASRPDGHPVPELVQFLHESIAGDEACGVAALAALVARHAGRAASTMPPERAAVEELAVVLSMTADALRGLSFLSSYPLAVVGADGVAELWTGVRRKHRVARSLNVGSGAPFEPGDPVLLGPSGRIVPLAPLVRSFKPSARAEPELFLLEGKGRRGAPLVAFPGGFEHTSDEARAWLDQVAAISDETGSDAPVALDAPYRGLAPLTAADASVFFGREREVEAFLNRLRGEPLLVVVGPSGAGKSSFLRAGVVPSLGEAFHPIVLRPGATPLRTLRTKLAHVGVRTDDLETARDGGELAARVHAVARSRAETLVLCVDQFEETFTMARDAAERAVFFAWLAALSSSATDPCRVVLTLRDDFLGKLQHEPALEGKLAPALELLSTPSAPALRRILVEPARRAGFAFESEALVEDMVRAVEGRPGALALLSFAASKLWEQRDEERCTLGGAAYAAMGGIAGALAQHGEAVLEAMTPRQRGLVRDAFRRLVTADGTRAATRHDELLAVLGGDESARIVVERLVAARLLVVAEGDDGVEHVEVIHEALLSAWPRIVDWQREDAAGNRLRHQIRAAAQQWEAHKRPRGLLWRDDILEDYRRWRLQHPGGLTASEEAFGKASLAERDRGRRFRAAMIGLLAGAAILTSYVAWQQSVARRAAQRATLQVGQATEAAKQADFHAEQSASRARDAARLAATHVHVGDPTTQLALLRDVESSAPPPEWAAAARAALHAGVASEVRAAQSSPVWSVVFSPDGTRIAATDDDTVRVTRADGAGDPVVLRGHRARVTGLSFTRDGRRLASSSLDGTVRVWCADDSCRPLVLDGHTARVWGVSFSPDDRLLAFVASDKTVRVARADGSGASVVLRGHTGIVTSVAFGPDGRRVASSSEDGTVRVWNADGAGPPLVLRGHREAVVDVAFSPDGRHLASASADRTVRVWSLDGGGKPVVLEGHEEGVVGVDFSPDGRRVASSSLDETVRVWNADGSGSPRVLRGHESTVIGVSFSPDGRRVVSGDYVGVVRVWNVDGADDPLVLRGHTDMVEALAISPDGRRFASGSDDRTVRVWSADGSRPPLVLRGHQGMVYSASFSPDGRHLATGSMDRTVRVWNTDGTGRPVVLRGHPAPVYGVSFSPDGRHLASASADRTIRVWNTDGSGEPTVLEGHAGGVLPVGFSPDGRRIVSGSEDTTVRVWNADGSGEPLVLRGHNGVVLDVVFSPDGQRIASASADRTVRIWNSDGSGEPMVFRSDAPANAVSFRPDGRQIAWNAGAMIQLRNLGPGYEPGEAVLLQGHTGVITNVMFSPDGRRLVSSSEDKTIRVWSDLTPLVPDDARLWEATSYCLPAERLEKLLGIDQDVARALHLRCLGRAQRT